MDFYWILLVNAIFTIFVGAWLFRYFTDVFNLQAELVDKILLHLNNAKDEMPKTQTSLDDYIEEE
tara:strand:- start:121 stop:315 length:195 start_codon:yes stop_codon:yes gene_type:complete